MSLLDITAGVKQTSVEGGLFVSILWKDMIAHPGDVEDKPFSHHSLFKCLLSDKTMSPNTFAEHSIWANHDMGLKWNTISELQCHIYAVLY